MGDLPPAAPHPLLARMLPGPYARQFPFYMSLIFLGGVVLLVLSAFTGAGGDIIVGDGIRYFEYARSLMIEGHLPRERVVYPCGVSLIGMIGYAPSVWLGRALGWMQEGRAAEGWALANQVAFCLPMIALSLAGMIAALRMLERLGFDRDLARFALLVWFTGTNVPYYVFKEPAMSESATMASLSIYYYLIVRLGYRRPEDPERGAPGIAAWALAGCALGLAAIVRQQNALHGLAVVILMATMAAPHWRMNPPRAVGLWARAVVPVAAVSLAIFTIPYLAWAAADAPLSAYSYGDQGFNFTHPKLLAVLFRPAANGLLFWTPIYALAVAGWIPFFRTHRRLAATFLVPALLQYYLIASWWAYSFGTSVGHRGFFTVLPLLLPGLAGLLQAARRHRLELPLTLLLFVLIGLNLALLLLISMGIIDIRQG